MKKNGKKVARDIIKWLLAIFMFSGCLVFKFSFASIIFVILGVYFLPVAPIQNFLNKFLPKKKIYRRIIAIVLFVVGVCTAPQLETTTPETTTPPEVSISDETSTDSTAEDTAEIESDTTNISTEEEANDPSTDTSTEPTNESTVPPENSTFEIHFIDVGQADAALVLCDGKAMLIDGGNAEDSSLLYTYLKNHNISHLDYVIGTHAHEDHIGGLAGALNYATVDVAYCPATSYDTKAFNNFVKALDKHGVSISVPSVGDSITLGSATCSILAVNTDGSDPNNSSIVLRIVYGDTSFLFTGDAEREVEQAILDHGTNIKSTVLKVGHHGSESSTCYVWLREIMPQYAVISVGKDNTYGHPTEEVLSRLRDAEVKTFRTDLQGDIICTSDGKVVTFTVERNADTDVFGGIGENSTQQTNPENNSTEADPPETDPPASDPPETDPPASDPPEADPPATDPPASDPPATDPPATEEPTDNKQSYVVNTNSKKFHYPSCRSVGDMNAENRWDYYGTREELISMEYEPCKNCDP